MKTVTTLEDFREARSHLPSPVGFVPTMGYLHEGHLSLVRKARQENASTIVSIFVNPTQFNQSKDLDNYPRDLPRDSMMIRDIGNDLLWTPEVHDIYPAGSQTWVDLVDITRFLEGKMRPGHFRGVATVVTKLFIAVRPDKAYFGQKDAQQVAVIRRMTEDLLFPVEIITCPTIRENDGLAMSSRNTHLDPVNRQASTILFRSLSTASSEFEKGEQNASRLREVMASVLNQEPLAQVEYVSCAHPETFYELDTIQDQALLSMAVVFGKTRLIDNILIGE